MNNVFVYCEIEGTTVADVSLELLTKGRKLANQLGCQLEAIAAGTGLAGIEKQVLPYGVDKLHVFDAPGLFPYTSLPHTSILVNLFKEEKPQICLMGATVIGRDLGPRVSSALTSGLTADYTLSGVLDALKAYKFGNESFPTFAINYFKNAGTFYSEPVYPELPTLLQWMNGMSMSRISKTTGQTPTEVKQTILTSISQLRGPRVC